MGADKEIAKDAFPGSASAPVFAPQFAAHERHCGVKRYKLDLNVRHRQVKSGASREESPNLGPNHRARDQFSFAMGRLKRGR